MDDVYSEMRSLLTAWGLAEYIATFEGKKYAYSSYYILPNLKPFMQYPLYLKPTSLVLLADKTQYN